MQHPRRRQAHPDRRGYASSSAVAAFGGTGLIVFYSQFTTTTQRQVPERTLSRVSSYDWFASLAVYPVGLAIAGPVGAALGAYTVLWATGLIELTVILSLLLSPAFASSPTKRRQTPDRVRPPSAPDAGAGSGTATFSAENGLRRRGSQGEGAVHGRGAGCRR